MIHILKRPSNNLFPMLPPLLPQHFLLIVIRVSHMSRIAPQCDSRCSISPSLPQLRSHEILRPSHNATGCLSIRNLSNRIWYILKILVRFRVARRSKCFVVKFYHLLSSVEFVFVRFLGILVAISYCVKLGRWKVNIRGFASAGNSYLKVSRLKAQRSVRVYVNRLLLLVWIVCNC